MSEETPRGPPVCSVCNQALEGKQDVHTIVGKGATNSQTVYKNRIVCGEHLKAIPLTPVSAGAQQVKFNEDVKTPFIPVFKHKGGEVQYEQLVQEVTSAISDRHIAVMTLIEQKDEVDQLTKDLNLLQGMVQSVATPLPVDKKDEESTAEDMQAEPKALTGDMTHTEAKKEIRLRLSENKTASKSVRDAEQALADAVKEQRSKMITTGHALLEWSGFKRRTSDMHTDKLANTFASELDAFIRGANKPTRNRRTKIATSCLNMAKLDQLLALNKCILGGVVLAKWPNFRKFTESQMRLDNVMEALNAKDDVRTESAKLVLQIWKQTATKVKQTEGRRAPKRKGSPQDEESPLKKTVISPNE